MKIFLAVLGSVIILSILLTPVGAQISESVNRVFITNDVRNPIPIFSRETLKVEGEVKIDGNPKVKLDDDTKIKIESIDAPVKVQFEKNEAMPETSIFKSGKKYNISFDGKTIQRCEVDKINGTWIYCERKRIEGEIVGWINTSRISLVVER